MKLFQLFNYLFVNPFLINEFKPVKKEIIKQIYHTKNISFINGFYGQIGPNPQFFNITDNNYHLFDGDGMIHGVFIKNNKIIYTNHWIKTDKFKFENKIKNNLPINMGSLHNIPVLLLSISYKLLELIGLLPNFMGTANTALWENNKKVYALHERDVPYELDININNNSISTIKKMDLNNIKYFTAHPKSDNNNIYAISYDNIFTNTKVLKYDTNMNLLNELTVITKYKSIIHDFVLTNNSIILCDMPFEFNLSRILINKLPFYFDKTKNVRFCIISKDLKSFKWIECDENFFIFHFDQSYEDDNYIYFNGVTYDNFEMDMLAKSRDQYIVNKPKYRQFQINKNNNSIKMIKNNDFERLNLEFPNSIGNVSVLSIYDDNLNTIGFVISNNFKLKKEMKLNNRFIYAEPILFEGDDNKLYIICFTYNNHYDNYLNIYDISNDKNIEIKLDNIKINKGFHSIFYK
jgi:carotenoid cleavage dioxygenase